MSTFKLHPLHTEQMHLDQMKHRGVHGYHEFVAEGRCTGRSTAQALGYLSRAIETPNKWIDVEDHANVSQGLSGRRIAKLDVELACTVVRMSITLGLEHIYCQGSKVIFERRVKPELAPEFPPDLPRAGVAAGYAADLETVRVLMRKHGWLSAYTKIGDKNADGQDRICFSREPGTTQE